LGEYNKSIELLESLLECCKETYGLDHGLTLEITIQLSATYRFQQDYEKALELEQTAGYELAKQALGDENPITLEHMGELGFIYIGLGKYNDALQIQEQLVMRVTSVLGENHPETMNQFAGLARTLICLKQYESYCLRQINVLEGIVDYHW
jgi:tetratricopeptide (TPR) repeat protein